MFKEKIQSILKNICGALVLPVLMYVVMMIFCFQNGKMYYGSVAMWRSLISTIAASATCAYGIGIQFKSGRLDFSAGSVMLLSAIIAGNVSQMFGNNLIIFSLLCIFLCVLLNIGVAIVYIYGRLPIIIVTLGMALLYEVPDIAEISEALSRFFSYNVRGKGYATIREIADHIHDYASIIGYRFMNKYTISIEIEEDVMEQCMPKMIIQPLVENAVFHGLEPKEESGTVGVFVGKEKERLAIRVWDSGCGMDEKELETLKNKLKEFDRTSLLPMQKHGIGMVNIYRRLRLFYSDQLEFNVTSKKGEGTRIEILVPLDRKMEGEEHVSGILD